MAITAPQTGGKEYPDVTVLASFSLGRLDEYPILTAQYVAAITAFEEDGVTPKLNVFSKQLHRRARGWEPWTITLISNTPECKTKMETMLYNITVALLMGQGNIDVDDAIEQEIIKLELDRRNGLLPNGASVSPNAP
jgi:hypothetical protein